MMIGAEAANHKEQVFPNAKWVFPERFSQQRSGFFQNGDQPEKVPNTGFQLTTGFPNE